MDAAGEVDGQINYCLKVSVMNSSISAVSIVDKG